jgi:cell division protein FtsL
VNSERDDILEAISPLFEETTLGLRSYIVMVLLLFIVLLLAFPKVYLNNTIYYKSKEIALLEKEHEILKQENLKLQENVEKLKFKNRILDSLF